MNNYKLYGCAPRFDSYDQCVVYQLSTNKYTNYFEEANEVENCPQVRQMTFKYINNIKKEIIFRIKFQQIVPYDKFLIVKPLHLFEFDILLLTLIETLYYLNKKNIYIDKQCKLYLQINSDRNIQQNSEKNIVQEIKFMLNGIKTQIKATTELIEMHHIEINFRNEFNMQLNNLNSQIDEFYKKIALLPKILERLDNYQKNNYINFIKSQLFQISSIFSNLIYQEDLEPRLSEEEIKQQEQNQKQSKQQNQKQSKQQNQKQSLGKKNDLHLETQDQSKNNLKQIEPSLELQISQKNENQVNYVQFLKSIYTNLKQEQQDFLNEAIQSIIQLNSEQYEHQIYSKLNETLTPLQQELNILCQIQNNYSLYLKHQPQKQNDQKMRFLNSQLPETIIKYDSKTQINDQQYQIINLDWDHFQIYLMEITKRQDKNYQNQISMIKLMIKQFLSTNKYQLFNEQFKEIILLSEDLEYESQIDMKFILKQDYIKNLLNKTRLKEQFELLETQGYVKQDYTKIKKQLQKSFYNEMITFYKIKGAVPVDNKLWFFPYTLPDIRIIQIRIHVLKEFKKNIKYIFDSFINKYDEAKNLLYSLLLVSYQLIQIELQKIRIIEYPPSQALNNKEDFKNFYQEIQTKIEKLQQNQQVAGICPKFLNNPFGQYNKSLLNLGFGELMQKPEIMNKFNKLIKQYKTQYDQIYKEKPTKENFYRYILYRSLRFLQSSQMPYNLSILLLDLPYDYDYEEYYLTIQNGTIQDVIELINNNGSKKVEQIKQKFVIYQ